MGIFRQFPYSNFHDMNMDELIKTVKEIQIGFEKGKEEYKKDITKMFNYIKEYLHNIHIPTKTSELANDSGFITQADVPTKTSELDNDSGFITSNDIPAVNNGVLTIQKNGTDIVKFSANQTENATANITVPTVSNGKLTIQRNGTTVKTFTANQSSNVTANISVPVAVSELSNDSGFINVSLEDVIGNSIPSIITGSAGNYIGKYYIIGPVVFIQISGTVTGTFAANDYWSAASGLPAPKDCPAILQVNSTGNDHVEASAVVNTSGAMILRSGSTALSGKTITIIGAYIKA